MRDSRVLFLFCTLALLLCGTVGSSEAFKLPDTGQTKCYQDVYPYAEITCPSPGSPLAQDGSYNINPKSYTVIGSNSDMVQDNNTGLIWQRQDDGNVYNWYQAVGEVNVSFNPSGGSFKNACGNLRTGGYSDWRVPSKKELITIVDYSIPYPGPTINASYFPNTQRSHYWLSTAYANDPGSAWYVDFYGGAASDSTEVYANYVRCVRGEQLNFGNFQDNGNGTVTDKSTGLMWQQGEPGTMSLGAALDYCEGLTLPSGGYSDWRLPNIIELESITDDTVFHPVNHPIAIDTNAFPNAVADYYWSSTTLVFYPDLDWTVGFWGGYYGDYDKSVALYVRCVRAGQGPAQVAVPNVVGLTQAAATTAITNAGLVVGTVTTASSNTVPAGNVISENPVAATMVNQGSAVNLVVSTGVTVNCPGDSLQTAVDAALPGDVINVTGTCNENVLIRNEKVRFVLDGQNVATVHGPSPSTATLNVRGKGIVIQNFEITGGSDGITVNRGSNAQIIHNNIHNTGGNGIVIDQLAFSVIRNNNIHDNPGDGILVTDNSIARIGFDSDSDSIASPNTIQNNGGNGITVLGISNARIVGNAIANNTGDGIGVFGCSQADIASNTINNNGGNGVSVGENSGIQLGEDNPTTFFDQPNTTTANNVGNGIACSMGAYVGGHLGTTNQINGTSGQTNLTGSCVNGGLVTP